MDGWAIGIPNDFKLFLSSYRNKEQLCQMLKEFWSSPDAAPPIIEMLNSNFGWKPTPTIVTRKGIHAFALYVNHAKMTCFKNFIIHSSDTDVFFTLLCHTCYMDITIYLDTATGTKRQVQSWFISPSFLPSLVFSHPEK